MKKRVLAGIVMMIMVFASVMGVSAANSKTTDIYVSSSENGYYKVEAGADEFATLKASQYANVFDLIDGYNKGTVTVDKMLENAGADVKAAVQGKSVVWKVFDVVKVGGGNPTDGKHVITLDVPGLTTAMSDISVIHFDVTTGAWEVVPATVDATNKTITITLTNLSPIGIYAKGVTGGAAGTSPSTGVVTNNTWMLWTAAALIVLGAGVVATQKRR